MVLDKWSGKTKGYGFVSFKDPHDFSRALKEMNGVRRAQRPPVPAPSHRRRGRQRRAGSSAGKYVGNRPVKLRKSTWKDRMLDNKDKEEAMHFKDLKKTKMVPK